MLFIINTLVFKMTTLFDVYLNDIIVAIIGIISIYKTKQIVKKRDASYILSIVLISMISFSAVQLSSGAMETQVRLGILFFVISTLFIDKILRDDYRKSDLVWAIIYIFISINIFGTAYSFAGIPLVFLICFIIFLKNKKVDKARLSIVVAYIFAAILYIIEYFNFSGGGQKAECGRLFERIFEFFKHPLAFMRAILGYNASGLLGSAGYLDGKFNDDFYVIVGLIVTLIMVYAIVQFIRLRIYKKSYIPVLFMAYSFFVPVLVMLDREMSLKWCINEWYVVHTKLGLIGTIMILVYIYQNCIKKAEKIILALSAMIIFIGSIMGNVVHLQRAPHVKNYYLDKQPYLFAQSIEELPVDENNMTPLIASPEETMKSIEQMRKYNLSVYRYYNSYQKSLKIFGRYEAGSTLETINELNGIYEDYWMEPTCEFELKTKNEGNVVLEIYYNEEVNGDETGRIYVNDEEVAEYKLTGDVTKVIFKTEPNSKVKVRIENDFSKTVDSRIVSAVLKSITCT